MKWIDGVREAKKFKKQEGVGILGIYMGGYLNEVLCDHLMNYVESLEVNYVFIFPWLLSLFDNVEFRTVLVVWESF